MGVSALAPAGSRGAGRTLHVMGVSARNDLGPVDPVSREPLPGARWPLPAWAASAVSGDGLQVLLWNYESGGPARLATVATATLRQAPPFIAGISNLKGAALSWPVAHRLILARDERYGSPRGATRIEVTDPTRGRSLSIRNIPEHIAGWAPYRRGLLIALVGDDRPGGAALADIHISGQSRVLSADVLPATIFDNQPGGHEPAAALAFAPDQRTALLATTSSLLAIDVPTGVMRRLAGRPGLPVQQLEWLGTGHALLAVQETAASPVALSIVDGHSGQRRAIGLGSPGSQVVTAPGRVVVARPGGGLSVVTARGDVLASHRTDTPLFLYRRAGPYVMAQPEAHLGAAGRRIVVDVRSGAVVLDRAFDHAPSLLVPAQ